MTHDEKDFADANPFRALDRSRFRDASGVKKAPPRPIRGTAIFSRKTTPDGSNVPGSVENAVRSEQDEADSRLFLEAVGPAAHAAKAGASSRRSAFLMEERAAFQKIRSDAPAQTAHPARPARTEAVPARNPSPQPTPPPPPARTDAPAPSEEENAFVRAMRDVAPLNGKGRAVAPETPPPTPPAHAELSLQDFMDGKLEFALSMTGEYLEGHVVGLDELTMNKLRAGQYSPEAHLDLHGLNAVQAFQALVGFFRSAWHKGLRTVLVVPGRGRNSPDGIGVLRDKLQFWLTEEPFKRVVLAFCTARPADGGAGSVYILLRKYRKKGKIYWERTPADPDLF